MDEIARLMDTLSKADGLNQTPLAGVRTYKASQYQPRQPLCYEKGVIIVGQGSKRVFLGDREYEYNPDNYLVLSVPLPAECETMATPSEPLLALMVDIDLGMLGRIIGKMDDRIDHALIGQHGKNQGLFLAKAVPEIKETVLRLLRALNSTLEARVLGPGIVHELMFRIMCGENASSLYALSMRNTNLSRIDKALKQIHGNFQDPMDVNGLAGLVNMSTSAFHRAFKEVTSSSPIQYLKKVRLNKARSLLMESGMRVNEAAAGVGYESATQFSREFKRYFGHNPVETIGGTPVNL
ncbi:MAG: AraC family transcriptional regulator [Desulfobacteraceae bacterium]|nr:AraC family transcriptional regulator [Desulfobacteraceae bacterium]